MANIIDSSKLQNLVAGKTFEEVKDLTRNIPHLCLKEKANLYLIATEQECDELQSNGLVFEKDSNRLVCSAPNKINDVSLSQLEQVVVDTQKSTKIVTGFGNGVHVEYCEDGTMIRLYNYNGTWCTATTRCIDAKDSYWSSEKTFDAMFWELFDSSLLEQLDVTCTYVFILLHSENRIVVKHTRNSLVFVSRINTVTGVEDYRNVFANVMNIRRPKVIPQIDVTDIPSYYLPYKRGILVKLYNTDGKAWDVYKLDFEEYKKIKELRGNVPQIRMRYLEILSDPAQLALLEKYYPEHRFMFGMIKHALRNVVREVYKLYVESHIKHTVQVVETDKYYRTLRQLHAQYKNTSKPISCLDVETKIFSLDKSVLKMMLGFQ
jgi:hypothetical protein